MNTPPENQVPNTPIGKDTRWKAGVSGNPAGRPKKEVSLVSLLKEDLDKIPTGEKKGRTNAQLISEQLLKLARTGSIKAIKEILDRVDGRVKQQIDIANPEGECFRTAGMDLSQLSTADIMVMLEILNKATDDPDNPPELTPAA